MRIVVRIIKHLTNSCNLTSQTVTLFVPKSPPACDAAELGVRVHRDAIIMSIEKTSFYFLLTCITFLLGSGVLFGVVEYTSYDDLFIPPADFHNSSVNNLAEITNFESLKKACLFWAEGTDSRSQLIDELLSQFRSLINFTFKTIIVLSLLFGYGFASIYIKLRKTRIENQNAL